MLGLAYPAAAEFYRYKDAHGNTIYTDDYSKVPKEQRDKAQSYDEYVSGPNEDSSETPPQETDQQTDTHVQNDKERQRLQEQEKALAKEFDGLSAERDMLDKEKKEAVTKAQIRNYNHKVVEFNARIKAYEEKRNAHSAEVEKYNKDLNTPEPTKQSQ